MACFPPPHPPFFQVTSDNKQNKSESVQQLIILGLYQSCQSQTEPVKLKKN